MQLVSYQKQFESISLPFCMTFEFSVLVSEAKPICDLFELNRYSLNFLCRPLNSFQSSCWLLSGNLGYGNKIVLGLEWTTKLRFELKGRTQICRLSFINFSVKLLICAPVKEVESFCVLFQGALCGHICIETLIHTECDALHLVGKIT